MPWRSNDKKSKSYLELLDEFFRIDDNESWMRDCGASSVCESVRSPSRIESKWFENSEMDRRKSLPCCGSWAPKNFAKCDPKSFWSASNAAW